MFYLGLVLGAAVGFLSSIAFPGVVAYLRAGYFAKALGGDGNAHHL